MEAGIPVSSKVPCLLIPGVRIVTLIGSRYMCEMGLIPSCRSACEVAPDSDALAAGSAV